MQRDTIKNVNSHTCTCMCTSLHLSVWRLCVDIFITYTLVYDACVADWAFKCLFKTEEMFIICTVYFDL